jgi:hypothetical protein
MTNNEQPERRRRSMLITPGEAERPGAAMRLRYLPPAVSIHRVELEKNIVADAFFYPQNTTFSELKTDGWGDYITLGEAGADTEGSDLHISIWQETNKKE